jgi:hypothetical protein
MKKFGYILGSCLYIYLLAFQLIPTWTVWLYFGGVAAHVVFAKTKLLALQAFLLSMPFFLALPNSYSTSLSMWRPLLLLLLVKIFWSKLRHYIINTSFWQDPARPRKIWLGLKTAWKNLLVYEKLGLAFWLLGLVSLILAEFPLRGLSQLVFLAQTALLYPIVIQVVKTREDFLSLLKSLVIATGTIICIGYFQLILTLVMNFYYFWQFWAMQVASLFYGRDLSNVLTFSNSWFSLEGGVQNLRMFSVMPSSHAFAMVCVFFLAFLTPFLAIRLKKKKIFPITKERYIHPGKPLSESLKEFWSGRMPIWYALRFSGLAVILSGTRGVWVGMLAPLLATLYLWRKKIFEQGAKLWVLILSLVLIFFAISPLINIGLNYVRVTALKENFLERASSIYDFNEKSNVGRLQIWQESLSFAFQHPLGVGYGNFISALDRDNTSYTEVGEKLNKRYNLPQRYVTAHSWFLQILVEMSFLGLVVFFLAWLYFFKLVWEYLKSHSDRLTPENLYLFSIALVFLWFLAYSAFDLTWLNDKILLLTFGSLALVKIQLLPGSRQQKQDTK